MPRRAYGYARVSGAEQGRTGTSLDAQQEEIRRYCASRGWPAPSLRVEVESASYETLERRVVLRQLLRELAPGDVVLVTRVDRWSRDIPYAVQSVRDLVKRGVGWVAIGDGIDAATEHGDSMLGIMAWAADQERQRIRTRTVGRRKALRDQGLYVEGLPPCGYRRSGRTLVVVEADARLVREAYRRCLRGQSLARIGEALSGRGTGARRWDKKSVHSLIRTRTYLGEVRDSHGQWIRGAHEPIIAPDVWRRAQEALASRRLGGRPPSTPRTADWLLRGLASCALCGARMGPAYSPSGDGRTELHYYACGRRVRHGDCPARYVRVESADLAVGQAVVERLQELRAELASPVGLVEEHAADRGDDLARLERQRVRLIDLASDGTISAAELRERLARLDRRRQQLGAEADAERRRAAVRRGPKRRAALAELRSLDGAWRRASVPQRRRIVAVLAERIELRTDAPPRVSWRPVEALTPDP